VNPGDRERAQQAIDRALDARDQVGSLCDRAMRLQALVIPGGSNWYEATILLAAAERSLRKAHEKMLAAIGPETHGERRG
jgi:hypothetical protein